MAKLDQLERVPRWRTVALLRAGYHLTVERWHDFRGKRSTESRGGDR